MRDFIKDKKSIYLFLGIVFSVFFLIIAVLQIFLKDRNVTASSGTINQIKENTSLVEKIYVDWWTSSLNKISSQGAKDVYEFKNTYKNLNIVVKESDVLRSIILNEIIIDGQPLSDYDFEVVESRDGKSVFKVSLNQFGKNNSSNLTKLITVHNRYDNIFYNIEVDSFQFRFNFSKDSDFLYLNFENYILDFYDKEFKVESNYYSDNNQNFIYNFGHLNKNVKIPIVNNLKVSALGQVVNTFFKENTRVTLHNRFGNPVVTFEVSSSGDLKILNSYNLSNVYDIELKDQVFVFDSDKDNIFKVEKKDNNSADIVNLIDNYKLYFDEDNMKTYKIYEESGKSDGELINFKIYRDLRNGNYVFTPNKELDLYKFYAFNENKFLSYNEDTNKFIEQDEIGKFSINDKKRIFDIENRLFLNRDGKNLKNYSYIGEGDEEDVDIFEFNDLSSAVFKRVDYDDIQKEIISGNYIQVLLKNKETGEFLSVNSKTNEALNQGFHYDSYLERNFSYNALENAISNFIFEIRPYNSETTNFNLYSKVKGTSVNTGYGILNNKLVFDKNDGDKVRFTLEKNDGRDNEFKIKDNYGSYLSFDESDDFAKVTSAGFLQKFFNNGSFFDIFEIYMVDFNEAEDINSGFYISFSSKSKGENVFITKISAKDKNLEDRYIDEYIVIRNKEMLFLEGNDLTRDLVITDDYKNLKGIENSLISSRDENYTGYRFRILNEINDTEDVVFKYNIN